MIFENSVDRWCAVAAFQYTYILHVVSSRVNCLLGGFLKRNIDYFNLLIQEYNEHLSKKNE